ncbi:hypothetical protein D3C80_1323390 [compost metagenome]
MLARASGLGSLGVQVRPGRALEKATACWPEPAAISSTRPLLGRWARSSFRMGSALRSEAGEARAPSGRAERVSMVRIWSCYPWQGSVATGKLAAAQQIYSGGSELRQRLTLRRLRWHCA